MQYFSFYCHFSSAKFSQTSQKTICVISEGSCWCLSFYLRLIIVKKQCLVRDASTPWLMVYSGERHWCTEEAVHFIVFSRMYTLQGCVPQRAQNMLQCVCLCKTRTPAVQSQLMWCSVSDMCLKKACCKMWGINDTSKMRRLGLWCNLSWIYL